MGKSTHFSGQPLYSQVINLLDKDKILKISKEHGGERYIKSFNCWSHLVVMLYAVIMRFDSLREISTSMLAEARKLSHLRLAVMPRRSTLSDANKRRPEVIFEEIYRSLYATYRSRLCSDSRSIKTPVWMKRLHIIDSTTITLFSNLIFKGVGRHPKMGKKNLRYEVLDNIMYQTPEGYMEVRIQHVVFAKSLNDGRTMKHNARLITYVDVQKRKLITLLTNDMEFDPNKVIAIYRQRWEIELLFKQMKQNFPLKYFYGESANAIKIQVWVTLIANLLLMIMKRGLTKSWSFSGLATMVRICLMYYVNFYSLFNSPDNDWEMVWKSVTQEPPNPSLFD